MRGPTMLDSSGPTPISRCEGHSLSELAVTQDIRSLMDPSSSLFRRVDEPASASILRSVASETSEYPEWDRGGHRLRRHRTNSQSTSGPSSSRRAVPAPSSVVVPLTDGGVGRRSVTRVTEAAETTLGGGAAGDFFFDFFLGAGLPGGARSKPSGSSISNSARISPTVCNAFTHSCRRALAQSRARRTAGLGLGLVSARLAASWRPT
mmetsp:Transcript_56797/g.151560  ORF Transcript_56797/g.151560 Transcript_56797/m.151560 type:complete len:207 (-) Transcript_56797:1054-1674(-)